MNRRSISCIGWVVIAFLMLGSILGMKFITAGNRSNAHPRWEISVDGKVWQQGILTDSLQQELLVPLAKGQARVIFVQGSISIERMPREICPRGICYEMGPISRPGQTIICLPNKLVIRIY